MSKKLAKALAANSCNNLTPVKALAFIREVTETHARQMQGVTDKEALLGLKRDLQDCRTLWSKGVMAEHNRCGGKELYISQGGYSQYIFPRSGCPAHIAKLYAK